ncbi:MAG: arginyltransferase [Spirochaetes bacterium]|jgi:arginine-tRNA-protein transferase|nr:arginyltransferase [Spirochaetota bacterium]
MRVQLFRINHGDCPYLPDRTWVTHTFQVGSLSESLYESMISQGWRRSGTAFYQNHCPGCNLCIPIRVPTHDFSPTKSQRRVLKKNSDVEVRMSPLEDEAEAYELYRLYNTTRHGEDETASRAGFRSFLFDSPIDTRVMWYSVGGRLVGIGWVDVVPNGLSSVYFVFDPAESARSLGTFSAMKEIETAAAMGKSWLYLGFYVPGCHKMSYKRRFRPFQLLEDGRWADYEE